MTHQDILTCYTDGASRGNPGPAAYAYLILSGDKIIEETSEYIGVTTNNVAEYQGVIAALTTAAKHTGRTVVLYSDSELVIKQINGQYRVRKEHLTGLHQKVIDLVRNFEKVHFYSVPRGNVYIRKVDGLCNLALDSISGNKNDR
jgi:Ribonuclease HI